MVRVTGRISAVRRVLIGRFYLRDVGKPRDSGSAGDGGYRLQRVEVFQRQGEVLRASRGDGPQQRLLFGAANPAFQVPSAHPLTLAHGGRGVASRFQCEGKPLFLKQHSEQPLPSM